jgi:hypothetical protein
VKEVTAQLPNYLAQATTLSRLSKETDLKPIIDFLEKYQNNPATRRIVQPLALALNKQFAEIEKQRAQRKQKARNHLAAYCWIAITFNSWYLRHKREASPEYPDIPDEETSGPPRFARREQWKLLPEAKKEDIIRRHRLISPDIGIDEIAEFYHDFGTPDPDRPEIVL